MSLWCIYIYIKESFLCCRSHISNIKKNNFNFSVPPWFTLNYKLWILLLVSKTFKTDLLRNPWGICSSIVDLKAKKPPSHEVKQTNWLKKKESLQTLNKTQSQNKTNKNLFYSLSLRTWTYISTCRMYNKNNKQKRGYLQSINLKAQSVWYSLSK